MSQPAPAIAPRKPLPASPCIGVCEMDAAAGRCRGCARTGDEIARWRDADDAFREAVWAELPDRIAAMGVNIRRLSWEPVEILDFVETTLREAQGAWVFGVYGAVAEVSRDPGEPIEIRRAEEAVEAVAPRAALRIRAPRGVRALAWREAPGRPERIVLALPKVRLGEPGPAALTSLGPDDAALLPDGLGLPRHDLGLGRAETRFTVRAADPALAATLDAAAGTAWPDHLAAVGAAIVAASPVRVVETPLGRAEVATAIPAQDGRSPEGPHTHLLPDLLAQGLATPPALLLPEAYAAGCVFHPAA